MLAKSSFKSRSLRPIAALSEVIEKPAARFGIRLENGLIGRMVEETRGADALPLLAYTLRELHENYGGDDLLTVAEYEQLGGVEGAIERKLTEALSDPRPTPAELAAFRRSFVRHLVRVDENAVEGKRYLRTAARRDSLPAEADRLIGRLQSARLLVAGDDGTISIAHERLIRNWSDVPLQSWLAEDSQDRKLIDSLKSFLAAHKEGGPLLSEKPLVDGRDFLKRDPSLAVDEPELAQFIRASLAAEQARERRQAGLLIGAVAAAIIFLVVAVAAVWSFLEARRRTAEAEFATLAANGARISALAQLPDHATEALVSAIWLVAPVLQSGRPLPPKAVSGLTDAIAAVGFSVPANHVLRGHTGGVESVTVSPDGRRILTTGADSTARLWDAETLALVNTYSPFGGGFAVPGVASTSFSPDGKQAVLALRNKALVLDATSGKSVADGDKDFIFAGFSLDGMRIITTGTGRIQLWDAATDEERESIEDLGAVIFAALSPDNTTLAYGGQRQVLVIRNLGSGTPSEQPMGGWLRSGAFAPTGRELLVASENSTLLWNVPRAEMIRQESRLQRIDAHVLQPTSRDGVRDPGSESRRAHGSQSQTAAYQRQRRQRFRAFQRWHADRDGGDRRQRSPGLGHRERQTSGNSRGAYRYRAIGGLHTGRPARRHRERRWHGAGLGFVVGPVGEQRGHWHEGDRAGRHIPGRPARRERQQRWKRRPVDGRPQMRSSSSTASCRHGTRQSSLPMARASLRLAKETSPGCGTPTRA
jgi:hypothetical protein